MKVEIGHLKREVLEQQPRVHWVELAQRWHELNPAFPKRSAASLKQKWKRIDQASAASNCSRGAPPSAIGGVVSMAEHNRVLEELQQLKETVSLN